MATFFTGGAQLVPLPSGRFDVRIANKVVTSCDGMGFTREEANLLIEKIEDACQVVLAQAEKSLLEISKWN